MFSIFDIADEFHEKTKTSYALIPSFSPTLAHSLLLKT